jgi:hypothetical protein
MVVGDYWVIVSQLTAGALTTTVMPPTTPDLQVVLLTGYCTTTGWCESVHVLVFVL